MKNFNLSVNAAVNNFLKFKSYIELTREMVNHYNQMKKEYNNITKEYIR